MVFWISAALAGGSFVGAEGRALILTSTDVTAEVVADVAVVEVRETFENPYDQALDATYVFPLPVGAGLRELVITCGDRVIRGDLQTREQARKAYDEALEQGKRAALVEQQRPNLFTQRVGGLCPHETIEVQLQYVEDLQVSDGVHTFVFPTTTGERDQPGDLRQAPQLPSETPGRALTLDLWVDSGAPIASVWSDSYAIDVLGESAEGVRVALAQPAQPNADVVVQWKLAVEEPKLSTLTARDARGVAYVGLTLHPPVPEAAPPARPRELFFVLDASCSMSGKPWQDASATVELALGALRPDERFNLIRFGDDATAAFPAPVAVDAASVEAARAWLAGNQASGGTNMEAGVVRALDMAGDPEALRMLVLLTDGYIGVEQAFFQTVSEHLKPNDRIFGLGIGSSVNRHLIDGLAHHGRGAALYQLEDTPMEETIATLYRRLDRPVLTDISIDWGGLDVELTGPVADLFVGQPLQVVGRVRGGRAGEVVVHGRIAGQPWSTTASIDLDEASVHEALPAIWARKRIAAWAYDLEANAEQQEERVTALALEHHLVSSFTSLIAVDSQPNGCGTAKAAEVPVLAPSGVQRGAGGLGTVGLGRGGGGTASGIGGLAGAGYGTGGGSFGSKGPGGTLAAATPVVVGSLEASAIRAVIQRHQNQLRYCYQRELAKKPKLAGKIVVRFSIEGDGLVGAATLAEDGPKDAGLGACVVGRFKRMVFPVPAGGGSVSVSYPLVFAP